MKTAIHTLLVSLIFAVPSFAADTSPTSPGDLKQQVEAAIKALPDFTGDLYFTNGPAKTLLEMDMRAVPFLIPHLSDTQMTKASVMDMRGNQMHFAVNKIVAHVITQLCGHHFYILAGRDNIVSTLEDPLTDEKTIAIYQDQIRHWHLIFQHYPEAMRRLEDIDDPCHLNRFDAYRFFEKTGDKSGRERLRAKVSMLLTEPSLNTLTQSELVSCAEALAAIGNTDDIPLLRSIETYYFEKKIHASAWIDELFMLNRARIKLGDKEQVMKDLNAFKDAYYSKLEQSERAEFDEEFKKIQ